MAKQVKKHLKENSSDESRFRRVVNFDEHRRQFWAEVILNYLLEIWIRFRISPVQIDSITLIGIRNKLFLYFFA